MRSLLLALFLCVTAHASFAQQIEVYRTDGTFKAYEPQRIRTIVKHDTIRVFVHDTDTRHDETITREIYHIDTGRVTLNLLIQQPEGQQALPKRHAAKLGVFGYADLHGATVAPAIAVDLSSIQFWVYTGVFYTSELKRTSFSVGISAFAPIFSY